MSLTREVISSDKAPLAIGPYSQGIRIGELVTFSASVNYTGRTSIEIGIRVETEDILLGKSRHTNSCYFTMVAMGSDGKPAEVPQLRPTGTIARQRFEAGRRRRELRRENELREQSIRAAVRDLTPEHDD